MPNRDFCQVLCMLLYIFNEKHICDRQHLRVCDWVLQSIMLLLESAKRVLLATDMIFSLYILSSSK